MSEWVSLRYHSERRLDGHIVLGVFWDDKGYWVAQVNGRYVLAGYDTEEQAKRGAEKKARVVLQKALEDLGTGGPG